MPGIIMYDSDDDSQFPRGAQAYAAYVDGNLASQPNYDWVKAEFPNAFHLSITVFPDRDADCLDVENGAASPADVPGWYERQRKRGITRPCLYASASLMQAAIIPVVRSGRIARPLVRLWSAHYAGQHICGPASCGALSIGADGTQWTSRAWGRNLDESLLAEGFFSDPSPSPAAPEPGPVPAWQEAMMNTLPVLRNGSQDRPGEVQFVHRVQALVACIGAVNGFGPVTGLTQDGDFGPATEAGVKRIQEFYRITQDGIVGPVTWQHLIAG
jgi:hypothetical protein